MPRLRAHLLALLGLHEEDADGFAAQAWHDERHIGGGYPVFSPDQPTRHGPSLRADHGRVHFADADRSTWPGTTEGAVRDGNRVASEILTRLR
ncbi:FAD-dependent oxidoreductase [Nocardiopsis tropica]|uniref:FAD-dependent oxidoreductase n=1 Tax=Nocardiopsis tropica TaxID=109330 RepID=A0ABU7KKF7_9ACTN|nr:FAD-dependent oxidoreductase [Nocardiopsis umidischolae]MEE2049627.1 FAD-dependent oxidoreductase [Nocardiopsis umidischolae]